MAMSSVLYAVLFAFSVAITTSRAFLSQSLAPHRIPVGHTATCRASRERLDDERENDSSYRTRYTRDSNEARELQSMRYEQDEPVDIVRNNHYYEDDEEEYEEEESYIVPRTVDEEDDEAAGNFWFNPKQGFDPLPSSRQRTSRLEEKTESHRERRPRPRPSGAPRRKTTFRSGAPKPPEPVADFYDRLFWYGFNPDETIAPGDKTLFGGTKGKFNGLALYDDDERRKPSRRRKRPPQQFRADEWYDDMIDSLDSECVDNEDFGEEISVSGGSAMEEERVSRARRSLPPEETYYSYEDEDHEEELNALETKVSRKRRQSPLQDNYCEEERYERRLRKPGRGRPTGKRRSGDRISSQVSSWFGPDDTDDDMKRRDNFGRAARNRPRRRKQQEEQSWSFTNILDGIFGVNREEVDINAAMYNRQMGLDDSGRSVGGRKRQRRQGYVEEVVETSSAAEVEVREDLNIPDVVDVDVVIEEEDIIEPPQRKRERTIEERAAAFERVPPSGVPAWGPSGAVGVDARTKATLDALEEIREATRKVELKEEQCIEAKEEIVVLKADFELQKKRLLASIDDPRRVRSRLRQMQMGIQDAARTLRRSRAELEVARDRLTDLEDRNWALLCLYDADKAFQEVVETFREFEESERLGTRLDVEEVPEAPCTDGNAPEIVDSDSPKTSKIVEMSERRDGDEPAAPGESGSDSQ